MRRNTSGVNQGATTRNRCGTLDESDAIALLMQRVPPGLLDQKIKMD